MIELIHAIIHGITLALLIISFGQGWQIKKQGKEIEQLKEDYKR